MCKLPQEKQIKQSIYKMKRKNEMVYFKTIKRKAKVNKKQK